MILITNMALHELHLEQPASILMTVVELVFHVMYIVRREPIVPRILVLHVVALHF